MSLFCRLIIICNSKLILKNTDIDHAQNFIEQQMSGGPTADGITDKHPKAKTMVEANSADSIEYRGVTFAVQAISEKNDLICGALPETGNTSMKKKKNGVGVHIRIQRDSLETFDLGVGWSFTMNFLGVVSEFIFWGAWFDTGKAEFEALFLDKDKVTFGTLLLLLLLLLLLVVIVVVVESFLIHFGNLGSRNNSGYGSSLNPRYYF